MTTLKYWNGTAWSAAFPAAPASATVQNYTSNASWTPPAGKTWAFIEAIGAGGTGLVSTPPVAGGGGEYASALLQISSLATPVAVTIGAASATQNTTGGSTTFGSYLTALGGKGDGHGGGNNAVPVSGAGGIAGDSAGGNGSVNGGNGGSSQLGAGGGAAGNNAGNAGGIGGQAAAARGFLKAGNGGSLDGGGNPAAATAPGGGGASGYSTFTPGQPGALRVTTW